jgi:Na+/H+-dicarboxylate symporter
MLDKLKNRSIQTIFVLTLYTIFAPSLDIRTHQSLYTMSIFIKDMLMWLMPVTIGVFIASTIDSFERKAPLFILVLILFEVCSNFFSVCYAYSVGILVSDQLPVFEIASTQDNLSALWRIPLTKPAWWGADKGGMVGLVIGCMSALFGSSQLKNFLGKARNVMEIILTKGFARLIPIFVLGFVAQIYTTGLLNHMILHYSVLVLYLLIAIIIYIISIFAIGNLFNLSGIIRDMKNLMPAGILAFTSGCSLSTMPWTIQGTEKNLQDPALAKALIPATTNIQQVGDCITQAFLCFLIYKNFFGHNPDLSTWSAFTIVFVAVRFTTVAMIGGAIFIMLPVYQQYLNFNDEMIAIILAFNVILDPIITSSNVVANGGLAKIFERIWRLVNIKK